VDVAVAGERYRLRAEVEPAGGAERRPVLEVYRDGDARYAVVYDADTGGEATPPARRLAPEEPSPSRVPEPAALRSATLDRLLDTPLTTYTGRVEREGESYHRVVGTGAPSGSLPTPDRGFVPTTTVRNYSAVVLFDESGHLEQVAVWYTLVDSPDPIAIRFRVVYDRRGTTTVTRPSWVDRAEANATAT
jgi:(2Fe-2S) ferredoxin